MTIEILRNAYHSKKLLLKFREPVNFTNYNNINEVIAMPTATATAAIA